MNDKMHSWSGATAFDLSASVGRASALEAAKQYTSTSVAAALQAAMRPMEEFRRQLETLNSTYSLQTAMEQSKMSAKYLEELTDLRALKFAAEHTAMRSTHYKELTGALERFKEPLSASSAQGILESMAKANESLSAKRLLKELRRQLETLNSTYSLRTAMEQSKMSAKYLEELTDLRALKFAAEHTAMRSTHYKALTGALERFKEPLSASSAQGILESMAKANESLSAKRLLEDATQLPKPEDAHEEAVHLVQDITAGVSKALTLQEAVDQIVQAIEATKTPLSQNLLLIVLVPLLISILSAFLNPIADFYIKKWLEETSKQEATKQVKEAARQSIGDIQLLDDFRFVSTQNLALKSGPKAKAPVVGQLRFGQTVRLLEKERDFTLVVWRSEDSKIELQGWVFSRYLRRFN
ncbi:SH3 domain-containing protein [Delftia sp. PS-11]|uniref:SH3 domain-containing protein n=1 Tax=Delftia sp. PS-11 TaxID=2767222 RepID=UPI0024538AC5|nr:SH3 domain-containing protein [Delftia sp. PS-11]KAJ8744614.1 SH3 domain-containing protein [Delftia sp. PS-11]